MIPLPIIGGILESVGKIADDLITTDKEREELALRGREIDQRNELGQIEVNKIEAASNSMFVAGWRPAVGWVCATALGVVYIPKALVMTAIWTYQALVVVGAWNGGGAAPALPMYPDLGVTDLLGLLGALLGFGGLRSLEKIRDVAR